MVVTKDDYINTVFRVIAKDAPELKQGQSRPAVILTHGLVDSSDTWIMNGKKSLAFILADAGYDVWAANFRGNKHSKHHLTLDVEADYRYYEQGSMIEQAKFDLPAFFEYIEMTCHV
mmetsp:Transcript_23/g.44  ORF Transcript_23/g.44 Transcript_23/m.44 type:complete len:117 (-) Transcript_23:838-1188(-)